MLHNLNSLPHGIIEYKFLIFVVYFNDLTSKFYANSSTCIAENFIFAIDGMCTEFA